MRGPEPQRKKRVRFLFVMDPAEKMLPDKDTSFAFMRGAAARGHDCLHCLPAQISNHGRRLFALARPIRVSDAAPFVQLGPPERLELSALDAIFIRKDPPFDAAYAHLTRQLDLIEPQTLIVNSPRGLRDANEKLFAFHFYQHMPRSLVSSAPDEILRFLSEVGGKAVLKPLDGAGGSGVVSLTEGDRNSRALIDLLTSEGKQLALVQEFLPTVERGDKRVLVLDGEPLGAILRVPRADDFRANIHVGGRVEQTTLDRDEQLVVSDVGARLREHGLWFVGLDLIGGKLIEVNVTSPTGIQELGRLDGTSPEQEVIAWVERRTAGNA
jgi:glutathione synthase